MSPAPAPPRTPVTPTPVPSEGRVINDGPGCDGCVWVLLAHGVALLLFATLYHFHNPILRLFAPWLGAIGEFLTPVP